MIFRLANPADDLKIRNLMHETTVPGHIRIAYLREPNFFDAFRAMDENAQVIVAEDNNQIVGVACRSIRNLLVNGKPSRMGYLSGLRLRPSARNGTTLARGYAYLKTLHADSQVPAYLTTIIHGNTRARDILTSGRANLPAYAPMGNYLTHVCPVRKHPAPSGSAPAIRIESAASLPPQVLTDYLLQEGAKRQFFPVHNANGPPSGILRSIGLHNVLVAQRQGLIAGTIAVWNQQTFKQHVIAGYSPFFRILRPFLNLGLRAGNYHPLPKVGEGLRCGNAALICIQNDDRPVFRALLHHALSVAAAQGLHQLAVGLHDRDPLLPALDGFLHTLYRSGLYRVSWDDNSPNDALDPKRIPYLELGTL